MTVKQLIEELQKLPQDKEVIIQHTDHTDWTYTTELTSDMIDEDKWYKELEDEDYKAIDERIENGTYEEDSEYPDVVKIYASFW